MSTTELMIWSMASGAIATVVFAGLADLATSRSRGALQRVVYHGVAWLFVIVMSGLPRELWPDSEPSLRTMQVVIGPVCSALGNYWMRGWLAAHQRDWTMDAGLRLSAYAAAVAAAGCLLLPANQQLPASAAVCLVNSGVIIWLSVRASLLGDRLALGIAAGSLLMLPAIAGLYAVAMGLGLGELAQGLIALCASVCMATIGFMLLQRGHRGHGRGRPAAGSSRFDPVTQLYSGVALVQKLVHAQRRRRRTRRDGAVLALLVFDLDRIAAQVGTGGVNEMFIQLAARIQRQVGAVNPVGRYYDRCFVTLVETIHSTAWLRTLGLRVASSARRPIEVTTDSGERVEIKADVGIGVVHLTREPAGVEDILHDAQRMAEAARAMRSRTAILDPVSGKVVPVELARLGGRRRGRRMEGDGVGLGHGAAATRF